MKHPSAFHGVAATGILAVLVSFSGAHMALADGINSATGIALPIGAGGSQYISIVPQNLMGTQGNIQFGCTPTSTGSPSNGCQAATSSTPSFAPMVWINSMTGQASFGSSLGIGTNSPGAAVDVYGNVPDVNNSTPGVRGGAWVQTSGPNSGFSTVTLATNKNTDALGNKGNLGWNIRGNADTLPWDTQADSLSFEYWNGTSVNNAVVILPSGNVGVGILAPQGNLDIENGSNTAKLCLNGACVQALSNVAAKAVTINGVQGGNDIGAAEWNAIIQSAVNTVIPQPRSANDTAVAAGWLSGCIITDPTGADGSVDRAISSLTAQTCRNLVCLYAFGAAPVLTATRGWCTEGYAYAACPSGHFRADIGCMYDYSGPSVSYP
jgi:hypothetical protein